VNSQAKGLPALQVASGLSYVMSAAQSIPHLRQPMQRSTRSFIGKLQKRRKKPSSDPLGRQAFEQEHNADDCLPLLMIKKPQMQGCVQMPV
jgi:hypothetical protein